MLQMPEDLPDDQIEVWQQASEYFHRAYHRQMRGDVAGAIADYRHSVNLYPTAEGFTFLGWALSYLSLYPEAIAACKRAIAIDPTFGNPYNDIGSVSGCAGRGRRGRDLVQTGHARPPPTAARSYPYVNLGRLLERRGQWPAALELYRRAVQISPDNREAVKLMHELQARFN